jgi:hypothetical protein
MRAPSRDAERRVVAAMADLIELERRPVVARLPAAHRALADAIEAVVGDVPPGLDGAYLSGWWHQGDAALWERRRGGWDGRPYLVPGRRRR